ncbi:hypothetical protein HAX54_021424 [Datura stramonium]|uniref:Non-specific serine/threonine protein kinase n=1 Tax=Datura stramonium TaxID=4076 RepID=A0ABS8UV41_DATST|nr:hypothetical protein [Datura stramonium]
MLDNGNFVLYNSDRKVMWQSFDHPTNTILPGQRLTPGQVLFSSVSATDDSTGIFRLIMQQDGWLVQYPVQTPYLAPYAYYTEGAVGGGNNVTLNLDNDGRLYLLNSTMKIKDLTTGGNPTQNQYLMKIDVDGIFRVYSHSLDQGNLSVIWASTRDRCSPKGICGLNGYCTQFDDKIKCECLPGFDYVNPSDWTAGCERNFTTESCKAEGGEVKYYNMRQVFSTSWENDSYAFVKTDTQNECEQSCLVDCNCEAALFKDSQCSKQKLPLRYGRQDTTVSNLEALVKVGILGSIPVYKDDGVRETKKKELRKDILAVSISLIIFAFLVLLVTGILIQKSHAWVYRKLNENKNLQLNEEIALRAFSYIELEQATSGFTEELGRGAFGTVFKGTLADNQKVVAVKRLENVSDTEHKEFQTEMEVIGKTHHRNLIRLLGYCQDGSKRLLVYEYMNNGSLADILFTQEKQLTWIERINIVRDIARGLGYLHEECETQIIHCDIKPQNILMDAQFLAKISDFGLAKLLKQDQTRTYTGIRGTKGYVAPEWYRKFPVTVKADVYSFGIVLFELICQRKAVDWSLPADEAILEEWVYDCLKVNELGKLVGTEEVDSIQLERMVKVGIWCIQDEPSLRPSMKKVLLMLEGTVEIPTPPSPKSFLSSV